MPFLEAEKTPFVARLHHLPDQRGRCGEADGQALLVGCQTEGERDMRLARTAWTESNDVLVPIDPFAARHFLHLHLVESGIAAKSTPSVAHSRASFWHSRWSVGSFRVLR